MRTQFDWFRNIIHYVNNILFFLKSQCNVYKPRSIGIVEHFGFQARRFSTLGDDGLAVEQADYDWDLTNTTKPSPRIGITRAVTSTVLTSSVTVDSSPISPYRDWRRVHQGDASVELTTIDLERMGLTRVFERMSFTGKEALRGILRGKHISSSVETENGALAQTQRFLPSGELRFSLNSFFVYLLQVLNEGRILEEFPQAADVLGDRDLARLQEQLAILIATELFVHEPAEAYFRAQFVWNDEHQLNAEVFAQAEGIIGLRSYAQLAGSTFDREAFVLLGKVLDILASPTQKRFSHCIGFYLAQIESPKVDLTVISAQVENLPRYRAARFNVETTNRVFDCFQNLPATTLASAVALAVVEREDGLEEVVAARTLVSHLTLVPQPTEADDKAEKAIVDVKDNTQAQPVEIPIGLLEKIFFKVLALYKATRLNVSCVVNKSKNNPRRCNPETNLNNEDIVLLSIALKERATLLVNQRIAALCRENNVRRKRLAEKLFRLLIDANRGLIFIFVTSEAKKYGVFSRHRIFDDLIQVAEIAIAKKYISYNPNQGAKFTTFIEPWVRQSVQREIQDKGHGDVHVPVHRQYDYQHIKKAFAAFREAHAQRSCSLDITEDIIWLVAWLTERYPRDGRAWSKEVILVTLEAQRVQVYSRQPISIDSPVNDDSDIPWQALYLADDSQAAIRRRQDNIAHKGILIEAALKCWQISLREELILRYLYGIGEGFGKVETLGSAGGTRTLTQAGKVFGLMLDRVRQVRNEALKKLIIVYQAVQRGEGLTLRRNPPSFNELPVSTQKQKLDFLFGIFGFNIAAILSLLDTPVEMLQYRLALVREHLPRADLRNHWILLLADQISVAEFRMLSDRVDFLLYLDGLQTAYLIRHPTPWPTLTFYHPQLSKLRQIYQTRIALLRAQELDELLAGDSYLIKWVSGGLTPRARGVGFRTPELAIAYFRHQVLEEMRSTSSDIYERYQRVREMFRKEECLLGEYVPEIIEVLQWFHEMKVINNGWVGHHHSSLFVKNICPVFEGSLATALRLSFPELDLNPIAFGRSKRQEGWLVAERGCSYVRYRFAVYAPNIYQAYLVFKRDLEDRIGFFDQSEYRIARVRVVRLFYAVNKEYLAGDLQLHTISDRRHAPCFQGSYGIGLRLSFPELDLNPIAFTAKDPDKTRKIEAYSLDWARYLLAVYKPGLYEKYLNFRVRLKREKELLGDYSPEATELLTAFYGVGREQVDSWDSCLLNKGLTPCFKGSVFVFMQKCFPELKLSPMAYPKAQGRTDWWQDKDLAVAWVRFKLAQALPELWQKYIALRRRIVSGEVNPREFTPEVVEVLKGVYEIDSDFIIRLGFWSSALNKDKCPYFKGTIAGLATECFSELRLIPIFFVGNDRCAGVWSNPEDNVDYVRFAIARERPELYARYLKVRVCLREQRPREEFLRDFVQLVEDLQRLTRADFHRYRIGTVIMGRAKAYFGCQDGIDVLGVVQYCFPEIPFRRNRGFATMHPQTRRQFILEGITERYPYLTQTRSLPCGAAVSACRQDTTGIKFLGITPIFNFASLDSSSFGWEIPAIVLGLVLLIFFTVRIYRRKHSNMAKVEKIALNAREDGGAVRSQTSLETAASNIVTEVSGGGENTEATRFQLTTTQQVPRKRRIASTDSSPDESTTAGRKKLLRTIKSFVGRGNFPLVEEAYQVMENFYGRRKDSRGEYLVDRQLAIVGDLPAVFLTRLPNRMVATRIIVAIFLLDVPCAQRRKFAQEIKAVRNPAAVRGAISNEVNQLVNKINYILYNIPYLENPKDSRHVFKYKSMLKDMIDTQEELILYLTLKVAYLERSTPEEKTVFAEMIDVVAALAYDYGLKGIEEYILKASYSKFYPQRLEEATKTQEQLMGMSHKDAQKYINETLVPLISEKLADIQVVNVYGRPKLPMSLLHRLAHREGYQASDIQAQEANEDLITLYIVTQNRNDCWSVFGELRISAELGEFTTSSDPNKPVVDDWLNKPSRTGYRSLHFLVKRRLGDTREIILEIHIMDKEMEKFVRFGAASSVIYKAEQRGHRHEKPLYTPDIDAEGIYTPDLHINLGRNIAEVKKQLEVGTRESRGKRIFVIVPTRTDYQIISLVKSENGPTPVDFLSHPEINILYKFDKLTITYFDQKTSQRQMVRITPVSRGRAQGKNLKALGMILQSGTIMEFVYSTDRRKQGFTEVPLNWLTCAHTPRSRILVVNHNAQIRRSNIEVGKVLLKECGINVNSLSRQEQNILKSIAHELDLGLENYLEELYLYFRLCITTSAITLEKIKQRIEEEKLKRR
ncbi:MAG: sigma factor [Candidatus Omnitrophota bacterium]